MACSEMLLDVKKSKTAGEWCWNLTLGYRKVRKSTGVDASSR